MMKASIAVVAFLVLAACGDDEARAKHVNTLEPTNGFGLLKQFHNINNSDDLVGLTIVMSTTSPSAQLYQASDGVNIDWSCVASAPTSTSDDTSTLPDRTIHRSVYDYSAAQCSDGTARTLAAGVYSITRVGSCSGRGCNPRKTYWYLNDGSITTE